MEDYLDEEEQIMNEQANEGKVISTEVFKNALSYLSPPGAISIDENEPIVTAINRMQKDKIGSVLLTKNGFLSGIFTERDVLMKVINKGVDIQTEKLADYMTPDPTCLRMGDMIVYALHNMHFGEFRHIPIVNDKQQPIAMVSTKDINNFLMDYFPAEIDYMCDEPFRGESLREGA